MKPSNITIYEYLTDFAKVRANDIFLFDEKRGYTTKEVLKLVHGLGNLFFINGINKNMKVALKATRSLEATLYLITLQSMGVMTYLIDPHGSVFETKDMDAYITNENEASEFDFSLYINNNKIKLTEIFDEERKFELLEDSKKPTMLIFTSGSTGDSKGVLLSQYAFVNNCLDTKPIGDYIDEDIALCMIPIHHVFAIALIICGIIIKYSVFFPSNTEVSHLIECIDKYKITRVNGVPSLYKGFVILKENASLATLRVGLIGGAPSTKEEVLDIESKLNMKLLPVYGMSECIGVSCTSIYMNDDDRLSGVGNVYSMNEVILVDRNGKEVKQGEEGEIRVKSPALASGYLTGPLDIEDGYLKTGDLGYIDDHNILHVSGRLKDIIICNGLNISSIKVEKAIERLKGVKECAVVSKPDEIRGEIPVAFVVSDITYTEEEIIEKSMSIIAKFERPREVYFIDELPKLSTGKIDKKALKKLAINN